MTRPALATDPEIDFASVQLGYQGFRELAVNPHLSPHGRIGFPDAYRSGREAAIFADICAKLPMLSQVGRTVLDIGPGCAALPHLLIAQCSRQSHRLYLLDSPEMLAQLPDGDGVVKIAGAFPACLGAGEVPRPGSVDAILCYSVLHYLFAETNPFHALDTVIALLAAGGAALFGDVPNLSKRRRFFASAAGRSFHREFTGGSDDPVVPQYEIAAGKIDDSVLLALMQRAQLAGCDAYLLPQPAHLPMANRRDDLLIRRP